MPAALEALSSTVVSLSPRRQQLSVNDKLVVTVDRLLQATPAISHDRTVTSLACFLIVASVVRRITHRCICHSVRF